MQQQDAANLPASNTIVLSGFRWLAHRLGGAGLFRPSNQDKTERRELKRLHRLNRALPGSTTLGGRPIEYIDGASAAAQYQNIFREGAYDFSSAQPNPLIIDCGANIGLALLYWKSRWPAARVLAFEADAGAYAVLRRNCASWHLNSVELIPAAVWTSVGKMAFHSDGADGSHLLDPGDVPPTANTRMVQTVRLKDYLKEPVDLLKLDIEGAEVEVLNDCADALTLVRLLFVEYHSWTGKPQRLDELLGVLRRAGYRVHLQPELVSPRPFRKLDVSNGKDQRVNVFAFRQPL